VFKDSIASVVGEPVSMVMIKKIEPVTSHRRRGRRVLSVSMKVDVEVAAKDVIAAEHVAKMLTSDNINARLTSAGLPRAEILSAPQVVQVPTGSSHEPDRQNLAVIVGSAVGGVVLIVVVLAGCCCRNKPKPLVELELPVTSETELSTGPREAEHLRQQVPHPPPPRYSPPCALELSIQELTLAPPLAHSGSRSAVTTAASSAFTPPAHPPPRRPPTRPPPAPPAPPPSEWLRYWDDDAQTHYFHLAATGVTEWTLPDGAACRDGDDESAQHAFGMSMMAASALAS
jgi:hypothetical protein